MAWLTLLFALALGAGPAASGPIAILPDSARVSLMQQCSRSVPPPGEAGWSPTLDDVAALEAALPAALAARPLGPAPDWSRLSDSWGRQYVGLVRGGRRFVYGNFFPRTVVGDDEAGQWRTQPVEICDGGPSFFGVEYDVEAGRITHLDFNGVG
jgi:hypothetical protein